VDRIDPQFFLGGSVDPFAAFLLQRSLKTLALRVTRQNENARSVVAAIESHPAVSRVHYPGRGSPEEEAIASRQMRGRGGTLAISLRGGGAAAQRFLARLEIVQVATSLGGVESLACRPADTSHRHLTPAQMAQRGIDEGLVRISLGIEDSADLARDITQALDAANVPAPPPL
jgi:cystathionine gamma-synthase